jgi:hypothetical protein
MDKDGDSPNATYSTASVIGMLQYLLAHLHPDITNAVSQCGHYVHWAKRLHAIVFEQIGPHLKEKIDKLLVLRPDGSLNIGNYDFAGLWPYKE